jgi:Mrp family chromosome partitioning ATPase
MNETTDAAAIFAPIWKRKWLILLAGIIVAAGAYGYYKHKRSVYGIATQIYLGNGGEEQSVFAGKKPAVPSPTNASALINSPLVREVVVRRLRAKRTPAARAALRGKVTTRGSEKSQFLSISGEAASRRAVALLVNTTAQVYTERQRENFVRGIERAISLTRRQLARVEAALASASIAKGKAGKTGGSAVSTSETLQAANLTAKINQLESELSIAGVKQVSTARPLKATLLSPKPKQNAIFGFLIGIFLASLVAYAISRFDRRVRSLAGVEEIFQTHVLAALPSVRHPIVRRAGRLVPSRHLTEPIVRLHTTLRLGDAVDGHPARPPRSILLLSADPGDGKSTVAAALSLVARDAGENVLLIEADFRRPVQASILDVQPRRGLTEVLSGAVALEEAVQAVASGQGQPEIPDSYAQVGLATSVQTRDTGTVSLLAGETGVANPPALLGGQAMRDVLQSAVDDYDQTLIDGPAPLQASDLMPLLGAVDGIVLVTRIGHTREVSARRLVQLLARTPSSPVLGVVVNAVASPEMERYGFSRPENHRGWRAKLVG